MLGRATAATAVLGDPADVVALDAPAWWCRAAAALSRVVGLDDVVVVDTPDAVLVTTRARAQDVKAVVDRLRQAADPT